MFSRLTHHLYHYTMGAPLNLLVARGSRGTGEGFIETFFAFALQHHYCNRLRFLTPSHYYNPCSAYVGELQADYHQA